MKYLWILVAITAVFSQSCKTKQKVSADKIPAGPQIDTLILREVCDYCMGEQSYYFPRKFEENTLCRCYWEFDVPDSINLAGTILKHAATIKHLTMENPSQYIFQIPFEKFKSLKSLYIFGNDYDCDALKTFPENLLNSKTLTSITFDGVRFDLKELERIKKEYPHITINGIISEYEAFWDKSGK